MNERSTIMIKNSVASNTMNNSQYQNSIEDNNFFQFQAAIANLLENKREEIIAIAAKHGAFNVRIFGSVALNQANENSDIDFLIDYDIDKISPWFPAGLVLDLEKLLGRKVDVATESALKERIREKVLAEAVAL